MRKKCCKIDRGIKLSNDPKPQKRARIRLTQGQKVTLKRNPDKGDPSREKSYTFVKEYPHHYSFLDAAGHRESFIEMELWQRMK